MDLSLTQQDSSYAIMNPTNKLESTALIAVAQGFVVSSLQSQWYCFMLKGKANEKETGDTWFDKKEHIAALDHGHPCLALPKEQHTEMESQKERQHYVKMSC